MVAPYRSANALNVRQAPAGPKGKESAVGDQTPSKGAMSAVGLTSLSGAMDELAKQHPHSYSDHGPHHGTSDHMRHMPLHGLHTKGSHGR